MNVSTLIVRAKGKKSKARSFRNRFQPYCANQFPSKINIDGFFVVYPANDCFSFSSRTRQIILLLVGIFLILLVTGIVLLIIASLSK